MFKIFLSAFIILQSVFAITAEYVWIEGEKPVTVPKIAAAGIPGDKGYEFKGWGNAKLFSESKALYISIAVARSISCSSLASTAPRKKLPPPTIMTT